MPSLWPSSSSAALEPYRHRRTYRGKGPSALPVGSGAVQAPYSTARTLTNTYLLPRSFYTGVSTADTSVRRQLLISR